MNYWALMEMVEDAGELLLGYVELPQGNDGSVDVVINPMVRLSFPWPHIVIRVKQHRHGWRDNDVQSTKAASPAMRMLSLWTIATTCLPIGICARS